MALSTFVGSFTVPASTGNKAVTGVGFQPKVVFFFGVKKSADASTSDSAGGTNTMPMTILGIGISSSQRMSIWTDDDFSSGNPDYRSTEVVHNTNHSVGNNYVADFVSLDSDGFTVNFITANVTAYIINFLAIGGTDLTNVSIVTGNSPGTTTGNKSFTGAGFQPDAVIIFGAPTVQPTGTRVGFGWASGTTARGGSGSNFDGTTGRYQRTNQAYIAVGGNVKKQEADLVSFDADGCTLNFSTADSIATSLGILYLKGAGFKAGNLLQKTSTGNQSTTGVGFQPKALILSSVLNTASTTIDTTRIVAMTGAVSDTTHRAVSHMGDNTDSISVLDRTKVYKCAADDATPTINAAADLSSFDSDGFTLNFSTADAVAREILFFAFGPSGGAAPADALEWKQKDQTAQLANNYASTIIFS